MKTYSLFLIFLFCKVSVVLGQELPQIIPPSPNAASLAQYADIPVSNYTGVPNISIPLFDIKSGAIGLPITLSYHASGIKVAQEASSVGLGWALNAGGVITRQVRGFDDFKFNGYISRPVPPSTSNNLPYIPPGNPLLYYNEYYHYLNSSNTVDRIDGEPDSFYYNFFGYSGQLFFEQQNYLNGTVTAVSADQNNLKFTFKKNDEEWTITDGNGWKYYLGKSSLYAVENTTNYDYTINGPYSSNPYILETRNIMPNDLSTEDADTAWYLTKVITPEGDKIEFVYSDNFHNNTLSNLLYSERIMQLVHLDEILNGPVAATPILPSANQHFSTFSQQLVKDVYLKKIIFKNGYIEFTTEDREDLRIRVSPLVPKAQRIKSAELFDLNNKSIKKVDFNYSYFNEHVIQSNPQHKEDFIRLKLDSVVESFKEENSSTYSSLPPYIFTYNSIALPDKLSFSVDYWGYYNGKNNNNINLNYYRYQNNNLYGTAVNNSNNFIVNTYSSALLSPAYINLNTNGIAYFQGANRDVNPVLTEAAVLNKITYPTGGFQNFHYGSNTYYSPDIYDAQRFDLFVIDYSDYEVLPEDKEATFTINEPVMFFITYEVYKNDYDYNNPTPFVGDAILEDLNGNKAIYLNSNLEFDEWGRYHTTRSIVLKPGTYHLYVDKGDAFTDVTVSAFYNNKIPVNKMNGAGIRIDSIITVDNESTIKRRIYSYEVDGISTGKMLSPRRYYYNEDYIQSINTGLGSNQATNQWVADYIIRLSENVNPFGYSAQGKIIGYDQVSVSDADSNNNSLGNSQYFYENIDEIPAEFFLPGVPNKINLSNGQLLKEIHTNKDGDTVNLKDYLYETNQPTIITIKGVKRYDINYPDSGAFYVGIRFYDVNSEWRYPTSTTETVFDINGNNPITTTTHYNYENPLHKNLTKTTTTDSKGKTLITTNKYPHDLPSGIDQTTSTVISSMVTDHVINPVIKSETTVGGSITSGSINNYTKETHTDENNVSNNMYLPLNVKTLKRGTTSEFENRLEFTEYDGNGHILQVQKPDGTPVSYVWGYNNEYPIAKIENANYSQVSGQVANLQALSNSDDDRCLDSVTGTCDEKNLRTALNALRNALPGAMVTTYTYDPMIGVTSITDPKGYTVYYEYDDFNRLEQVIDAEGYILSENEYNYKQ